MKELYKIARFPLIGLSTIIVLGFLIPEEPVIPARGASFSDWNSQSFWYEPWGTSGVHKGIDIFGTEKTPIVAATRGIVIYAGKIEKGGKVVVVLGPKWRVHYYAHLETKGVSTTDLIPAGEVLGSMGNTGNAAGKQPHLHYAILSLVPYPWRATGETQGWKRMFYLDPDEFLR
ncbi:M23 family metallopeptidase [Fodinibius halophilus]|uniref:M23 family metallopeptidase n=1 Tax=Fodinibius halophilus TaxID=1736908 RepID=A0A6M1TDL6_9BACT|nr:M23 family metallopeptidase [Fodinibius halophilus]NGP88262.1 M23 family metallopeptidase [Fodinibius halophilus]